MVVDTVSSCARCGHQSKLMPPGAGAFTRTTAMHSSLRVAPSFCFSVSFIIAVFCVLAVVADTITLLFLGSSFCLPGPT